MHDRRRAVVLLLVAAAFWSLGGVLIKWVSWHPLAISGGRSGIAALLLLTVVRRRNFTWSPAQLGGALGYAGTVVLFVVANKWTTAANAILLQYTAPAWIALLAPWVLGERTGRTNWLLVAMILGGMTLFFLDRLTFRSFWGNACAVASGFSFAWLVLCMRRQKAESPFESIFLGNLIALAVGVPFMFRAAPDAADLLGVGLLGVVQLGLPYILYAVAIRHVTALEAMLIPAVEPVLNPVWVFLVHAEKPGRWAMVGGVVVLGAVVVRAVLTGRGRSEPDRAAAEPIPGAARTP